MDNKYELILCIVNSGFSEMVMDAAKEEGARGGTVIHARGTANKEAEEFFHITIQPDKEIVMILVTKEIKDAVLHSIYRSAGLKTEGQGIAFSVPVDDVVGISDGSKNAAMQKVAEELLSESSEEQTEQKTEADENNALS